jgi:Hydantoinase/oxoprolinase N-terminal region
MVRIGIDVGGTFTDLVAVDDLGRATLEKVPSTPDDSSIGVLDGLALLARRLGRQRAALLAETDRIVHGTTVAIHALLERSGAHVGLFTTEGHRDVIVMREGLRDDRPAEGCARSRRRVVVRASSALVFEGGAAGFGGEAAALGGEGGLGRAARRISATRRSSASWRLRSWVRKRRAVITMTPSWVRRRPARRAARSRTCGGKVAARARSRRNCTAVASLLTFCPPGPEARIKLSSIWLSSRTISPIIGIMVRRSAVSWGDVRT